MLNSSFLLLLFEQIRTNSILSWSFSELQICMSVKWQLWARGWICLSSPTYSREWHASAVRETQHHNESWCSTGQRASQCSSFRFPPTTSERCPLGSLVITCYLQPRFRVHFSQPPTSFWITLFRLIFSILYSGKNKVMIQRQSFHPVQAVDQLYKYADLEYEVFQISMVWHHYHL